MKFLWIYVVSLMIVCNAHLSAKVRILTFHYNRHDFIELQYKSLQKFMHDDFELIVFNDANTPERDQAIREMCQKYGILCVRFEPEWHATDPLNVLIKAWLENPSVYSHLGFNRLPGQSVPVESVGIQPSVRHSHVIQYAMDHYGYNHDDIVVIMDGDIFPMRAVSVRDLLLDYDIVGTTRVVAEDNIDYLWVPFIAFKPRNLPNLQDLKFHVSLINDKISDTGSQTYHYLKNNPTVRFKKYFYTGSSGFYNWSIRNLRKAGFTSNEIWLIKTLPATQSVEFNIDNRFLHFGASSFGLEGHVEKAQCVTEFINKIVGY